MRYSPYEFNPDDAFRFARHVNIQTTHRGKNLNFKKCPYCGQNTDDKNTFAINLDNGTFNCLRASCGAKGNMLTLSRDFDFSLGNEVDEYYRPKKQFRKFKKPAAMIVPKDPAVKYMLSRGISEEVTKRYEITVRSDHENILVFPFYDETGELVFIKYRKTDFDKAKDKNKEWCEANSKPILFGMKQCNRRNKTLIVAEGQIDSLSISEAGFENALSVPTGAKGFTWVPYCWDFVNSFETLIVFGDHENGRITLLDEIRSRFRIRIKHVREEDYLDCKDANDILRKYGKGQIKKCIENAIDLPVNHVISLADVEDINPFDIPKLRTGFKDLDNLLHGGLPFGGIVILTGRAGHGKLLADYTPVFTKGGWKTHGELVVGDELLGVNGEFVKVTHIFPKWYANMRITFSNGEVIDCHENHEWVLNQQCGDRYKERILSTKEIAKMMEDGYTKAIRLIQPKPLEGENIHLWVKPYTLGVWLGNGRNGNPDVCSSEKDICVVKSIIEHDGYDVSWQTIHKDTGVRYFGFRGLREQLQKYGMCYSRKHIEKHIPHDYLIAPLEDRLELLAGLIDTDGYYNSAKRMYVYTTTDVKLRDSFIDLVHTMGCNCFYTTQKARISTSGIIGRKDLFHIGFIPRGINIPCRVKRKRSTEPLSKTQRAISIKKIERIPEVQGNCIEVEGGVYRVGKSMLPTHNSTVASQIIANAIDAKHRCFAYSGELPNHMFKSWLTYQVAGPSRVIQYDTQWGGKGFNVSNENKSMINDWFRGHIDIYDSTAFDDEQESIIKTTEEMMMRYGVDVVLIDNLMTALDLEVIEDSNKYERQSLFVKRLAKLAIRHTALIILVAHKRKFGGEDGGNDEISGSSDIINLGSVVLSYERGKDLPDDTRILKVTKNRLFGNVETKGWKMKYDEKSKRIYGDHDDLNHKFSWDKEYDEALPEDIPF